MQATLLVTDPIKSNPTFRWSKLINYQLSFIILLKFIETERLHYDAQNTGLKIRVISAGQ